MAFGAHSVIPHLSAARVGTGVTCFGLLVLQRCLDRQNRRKPGKRLSSGVILMSTGQNDRITHYVTIRTQLEQPAIQISGQALCHVSTRLRRINLQG